MPVTLCFIKDKHKIMEHKIPLETYFAGLLQKWNGRYRNTRTPQRTR